MAQIKEGDFVEVEYTGSIKGDDIVFDTTYKEVAEKNNLNPQNSTFGPAKICIGEGMILKGLEQELIGKEIGKEYDIELSAEKAFGKKDAKMIRMIPATVFKKNQIVPEPGLQVNIDGAIGIIKTASGGRCLVDFNHPLASKDLVYNVKVNRIIDDDKEKLSSLLKTTLSVEGTKIEIKDKVAQVVTKKEMPKELQDLIKKEVERLIPTIKDMKFVTASKEGQSKDKKVKDSKDKA